MNNKMEQKRSRCTWFEPCGFLVLAVLVHGCSVRHEIADETPEGTPTDETAEGEHDVSPTPPAPEDDDVSQSGTPEIGPTGSPAGGDDDVSPIAPTPRLTPTPGPPPTPTERPTPTSRPGLTPTPTAAPTPFLTPIPTTPTPGPTTHVTPTPASVTPTATPCAGMDADGDGYCVSEDCEDGNADVHPGADEACNGSDNDCDGYLPTCWGQAKWGIWSWLRSLFDGG